MWLTGKQFQILKKELLDSFQTRAKLSLMIREQFTLNLEEIAGGFNLTEYVTSLIRWAEVEDRVGELIEKACVARPEKSELHRAAKKLLSELKKRPPEDETKVQIRSLGLQRLANDFGLELVIKGGNRIKSPGQRRYRELYSKHEVLGGRFNPLAKLDRFYNEGKSGYFFVTGPEGLGKTALLANWVRSLGEERVGIAVHYISSYIDTSERFCFQRLCEQLLIHHGIGGELPNYDRDLRFLYADLLRLPLPEGHRILVVLDGLDEGLLHWDTYAPNTDMFPEKLPEGVQVVFSARTIADKDWLKELGLSLPTENIISLDSLSLDDIKDILQKSNLPQLDKKKMDETAERLIELSEGDPYYIRDLLDESSGDIAKLGELPVGHDRYLRRWWNDGLVKAFDKAFVDLMGCLLVARAPLNKRQLITFSDEDTIEDHNFSLMIEHAARTVIGNQDDGYQFPSTRIRNFVTENMIDSIHTYQNRFVDYCTNWNRLDIDDHTRDYMFEHAVEHHIDAGKWDEVLALLNPGWIKAKWDRFGSYIPYIQDLNLVAAAAMQRRPPDIVSSAVLSVARVTATEMMLNFPTPLLIAWVRMGDTDRVLARLDSLGSVKGLAVESLTEVAAALLEVTDKFDYTSIAADLLARAVGMLYKERSSTVQLERLEAIAELLRFGQGLEESHRVSLLGQARVFAQSFQKPAMRAAALSIVAEPLATVESGREQAATLVNGVHESLEEIEFEPDRLAIRAYILPAQARLDSDSVYDIVQSAFDGTSDPFQASFLAKQPLANLLEKWASIGILDEKEAVTLLEEIAKRCIDQDEPLGYVAGIAIRSLCELGRGYTAIQLIDSCWKRSGIAGARALLSAAKALNDVEPTATSQLLTKAKEFTDYSHHDIHINRELFTGQLARRLAIVGEWDSALDLLGTVRPMERDDAIIECLYLSSESFGRNESKMKSIITRLIDLSQDSDEQNRARIYATGGQVMLQHDEAEARRLVNQAASLYLSNLPEGSTDSLRQLLALALHEEGKHEEAAKVLEPMKWEKNKIKAYTALIDATPSTDQSILTKYGLAVMHVLPAAKEKALFDQALLNATHTVDCLRQKGTDVAEPLCDLIFEMSYNLKRYETFVYVNASESTARFRLDPKMGLKHFDNLIDLVNQWLADGIDIYVGTVDTILRNLATISSNQPRKVRKRTEKTRSLFRFFPDLKDKTKLNTAYAKAIAASDTKKAAAILREQLGSVERLGLLPPPAPHLRIMISQYTNRKVGPRYIQVDAARYVGEALSTLAIYDSEETVALLQELLTVIGKIDSPEDQAQALADFFEYCGKMPDSFQDQLTNVYSAGLEQAQNLRDSRLRDHALMRAIDIFCELQDSDRAHYVAGLIENNDKKKAAETSIGIAQERSEMGPLSAFERMFVDWGNRELFCAVLHSVKVNDETEEAINYLANEIASDRLQVQRSRFIDKFVRLMLAPARAMGGTEMISNIIEGIEDFDRRFLKVASLIAQQ